MKSIKKTHKNIAKKKAQQIQDDIFKKMSAEKKLTISFQLWQLTRELGPKK